MSNVLEKLIEEVFPDFSNCKNLKKAIVKKVNLYKKTNRFEILLQSDSLVDIKEIHEFEKYLIERFKFQIIVIKINYTSEFEIDIANKWKDIIEYMSYKYPSVKAILRNSIVEVNENIINVKLQLRGAEILVARGIDNTMSEIINNIYGKKYKINYFDNESEETIEEYKENARKMEEEAIRRANAEAIEQRKEAMAEERQRVEAREQELLARRKNNEANQSATQTSQAVSQPTSQAIPSQIPPPPPELPDSADGEQSPLIYGRSANIKDPLLKVVDLSVDTGKACIDGEIVNMGDTRELKTGKILIPFDVYDGSSTITCKIFAEADKSKEIIKRLKDAKGVRVAANVQYDPFAKELGAIANVIIETAGMKKVVRQDNSPVKRVELHMHTQMSQMDAMTSAKDLIKRAMKWGMKSIAITDHGVVQAFPDAHKLLGYNNPDMKVIYGVEAYYVPDKTPIVSRSKGQPIDTTYCVLDLETTGLSFRTDKITEVGIMKVKNGEVIDSFSCFVNPEKPIPPEVVEVTKITDEMVKDAETIEQVFPKILEFVGDSVLVAHNADFDIPFLKYHGHLLGYELNNTYMDTLRLAKVLFPEFTKYKLGFIADKLGIEVEVAHRALDDVDTTVKVMNVMMDMLKEKGAKTVDDIDIVTDDPDETKELYKKLPVYHAIILAKNYVGLKNLYKLVSISHLNYFYRKPRILKSVFKKYSEGLILGSACEAGELYRAIVGGKSDDEIERIASDYDYLEIQPNGNNMFMVRNGTVPDVNALEDINRKIVELGERLNKPVVATCDVHFMDPQDEVYRRILMAGQGFDDADEQAPLYLRTTEEMLKEFQYLGEEKAYEIVVENTNKIADMCERISPISPEKCPPYIDNCEQTIKDIAYTKAHELYGDPLPQIVQERLDKELDSIIKNGFSVMYIIAQKLVWKSNADGYLVGSRGSVGSSFVANMTGITEVNSLPPHYRCPNCKHSDFTDYGYKNGFDLPDKICPECGTKYDKDGMDIPFETFLGFNGDKEPDIDLNFSGEYQAKAHKYTEVIFGKGTTFKAGTVGTVADKTAYGYVQKYFEERGIPVNKPEIVRLAQGCTGIKRTTGQHPGGIIVVPKGREIFEFTPIQHPADDPNSDIITTHFDYHSIDQNLLKLDILGHDDPTIIRMLQDITGVDPQKIPLDDQETMSIFSSTKALGLTPEQIKSPVGSFGVPEFGTKFVRRNACRHKANNI